MFYAQFYGHPAEVNFVTTTILMVSDQYNNKNIFYKKIHRI